MGGMGRIFGRRPRLYDGNRTLAPCVPSPTCSAGRVTARGERRRGRVGWVHRPLSQFDFVGCCVDSAGFRE